MYADSSVSYTHMAAFVIMVKMTPVNIPSRWLSHANGPVTKIKEHTLFARNPAPKVSQSA